MITMADFKAMPPSAHDYDGWLKAMPPAHMTTMAD